MIRELSYDEFELVLESICTVTRIRDRAMIGLAHMAGLAPKEIAYVHFEDICDVDGIIGFNINVTSRGGSRLEPRTLPMPPLLRALLIDHVTHTGIKTGPLFFTKHGGPASANSVRVQLWKIYRRAGFSGASGYSGRKSYGVDLARTVEKTRTRSLKCVMEGLGLKHLESVLKYLDETGRQKALLGRSYNDGESQESHNARAR